MRDLPDAVLSPEHGRYPNRDRREVRRSADTRPIALDLDDVRQIARDNGGHVVESDGLAVSILCGGAVQCRRNLVPTHRRRTEGIGQRHVIAA